MASAKPFDGVYDRSGLAPDLVTLAHQGAKMYADRFELLCPREAGRLSEVWQADHTP